MTTELTKTESARLRSLETTIEGGKKVFVAVGAALSEIRDAKLYRATHASFDAYCRDRWGWGRSYAYRLMEASEVAASPIGDSIANEAQAREVARVPEEKRAEVVSRAVERAETAGRDLTAADMREAAKPEQEPAITVLPAPEPEQAEEEDDLGELMLGVCELAQEITRSASKKHLAGFAVRLRGLAALAEEISERMN